MPAIVAPTELTEKQILLVEALVSGANVSDATRLAGYANVAAASASLRSEKVALFFQQAMASRLAKGAPAMFSVLESVAQNRAAPAGARVDAAKAWLDRAGWTVPRAAPQTGPDKPMQEMTLDELRNKIKGLKDEAERNMVDVTPTQSVEDLF